jgi:BirA family biotin operon repressor/biotin-[acetyl-CoA-carboxylase] ligase
MTSDITLTKRPIGSIWINFKEIDSTNEKAHSLALEGFRDGTVITADRQTKGRGRRGNLWHSPEGGLYCSIILKPNIKTKNTPLFEKMVGIAVCETIASLVSQKPTIKTPNDILINGKKVAGILIEAKGRKDMPAYIIIGIGINCLGNLDSFPSYLKMKVTTLSREAKHLITPYKTLDVLLNFINKWYNIFLSGEIVRISNHWEKLLQEGPSCPICS